MYAEELIELLTQKNLISSDLLVGLRERIAQTPRSIPADLFADRLVEQNVLSPSLAKALLRQLQPKPSDASSEKVPEPDLELAPLPTSPAELSLQKSTPADVSISTRVSQRGIAKSAPPLAPEPVVESVSKPPVVSSTSPLEQPMPNEFSEGRSLTSKRLPSKKTKNQTWDTRLILFGSAGVLLLCLIGLFLVGSLTRRNAESLYVKANQSYEKAAFAQAINEYDDCLKAFPNHSGASTAKIRRALSRIRLLTDAKTDWLKTYETTVLELKNIQSESGFSDIAKDELAVLLPKIAEGLIDDAERNSSELYVKKAEETLNLIDEILPRSLRPGDRISRIRIRTENVLRVMSQDNFVREIRSDLEQLLNSDSLDRQTIARCYAMLDDARKHSPELASNKEFQEFFKTLASVESKAVRLNSDHLDKVELTQPTDAETSRTIDQSSQPVLLATLYDYRFESDALPEPSFLKALPLRIGKNLYGIDSGSGRPVWKRELASDWLFEQQGAFQSEIILQASAPVPASDQREENEPYRFGGTFFLIDPERWILYHFDAATGKVLKRLSIGERFYLSEVVRSEADWRLALTTVSGKLHAFSLTFSGKLLPLCSVELSQEVDSAPVFSSDSRSAYQIAARNSFYSIGMDFSEQRMEIVSTYFDHATLSVRVPPICVEGNLLVVRQTAPRSCELLVLATQATTDQPVGAIKQRFSIQGLVDTPLYWRQGALVLVSDSGETSLFEQTSNVATPLKLIATGQASTPKRDQPSMRFAAVSGRDIWVADGQLTRFAMQASRSALLPQDVVLRNLTTRLPLICSGKTLYHSFIRLPSNAARYAALSTEPANGATNKVKLSWEIELADSFVAEPRVIETQNKTVVWVETKLGKRWEIDGASFFEQISGPTDRDTGRENDSDVFVQDDLNLKTPVARLPEGAFGTQNLGGIVALTDGFEIWFPETNDTGPDQSCRTLYLYDPTAPTNNRFRSLILPAGLAAKPIRWQNGLLVPLQDGRLFLLEPRSGKSVAEPFMLLPSHQTEFSWSDPVLLDNADGVPNEILIVASGINTKDDSILYRLAIESVSDGQAIVRRNMLTLKGKPWTPLVSLDEQAFFVDSDGIVNVIDTQTKVDKSNGEPFTESQTYHLTTSCVWGPQRVGDTVLLASADGKIYSLKRGASPSTGMVFAPCPSPVGKAVMVPGGILLVDVEGTIRLLDSMTLKTVASKKTNLVFTAGPVLYRETILLPTKDGILFGIEFPFDSDKIESESTQNDATRNSR